MIASQTVSIGDDFSFHVTTDGPATGTPILFLHGFPDFSHGWRHQLPYFAAAGYRVIAPDLHGYSATSKPKDVARYRLDAVAADVLTLLDRLGIKQCHVVGHDWGAALTWRLVALAPERFATATVMCVPHLKVFFDHIRYNKHRQALRSWYMAFFQVPAVPELLFKRQGGRWFAKLLARSARRGTFSDADQAAYAAAWSQPGAPTAMLNWYRANVRGGRRRAQQNTDKIKPPMLIVWGDRDAALNHHMAEDSAAYCDDARVLHFAKASHWVHMEFAPAVNVALLEHVKRVAVQEA